MESLENCHYMFPEGRHGKGVLEFIIHIDKIVCDHLFYNLMYYIFLYLNNPDYWRQLFLVLTRIKYIWILSFLNILFYKNVYSFLFPRQSGIPYDPYLV